MDEEIFEETSNFATPENFDIFEVLDGGAYPKDAITVYLDEAAGYELRALQAEAESFTEEPDQETIQRINDSLVRLRDRIDKSARTFYLTGVDNDLIKAVWPAAEEHFESRKVNRKRADQSIIRELPQSAQADFMTYVSLVTMALHVEKVVDDSSGRELVAPGADGLEKFFSKAPAYAIREVSQAIERLQVDARDFERGLDDGFFPKP